MRPDSTTSEKGLSLARCKSDTEQTQTGWRNNKTSFHHSSDDEKEKN